MSELTALQSKNRSDEALAADHQANRIEANLIDRLKHRDSDALQEIMDIHFGPIRSLIGRLMAYDSETEDVVQSTFVQVWRKIDSFRNESSLKTWITRIAITQTRNHQRSMRRWVRRLQDGWIRDSAKHTNSISVHDGDDPRWELVQSAMQHLPYPDREILVLVFLQENTIQELAQAMNERPNTLEVRLHRAKRRLKQLIEEAKKEHE